MAINTDTFLGSGANLALVPETDLYIPIDASESSSTLIKATTAFTGKYSLVEDLYVGCIVEMHDATATPTLQSTHVVTTNDADSFTISPAHTITTLAVNDSDFMVVRSYGAPSVGQKNSSTKRLNADNWLGIVESASFPNVEVEVKQQNLSLGTSRNFTYQYKGIETASGGNVNLVCNHGAFLYYAFGACDQVTVTTVATNPTDSVTAASAGDVYIDVGNTAAGENAITTHLNQGPIFYKTGYAATGTAGTALTPPLLLHLNAVADTDKVTRPTITSGSITAPITYRFIESDGEELPSFALEQTLSKLESSNTFVTQDTGIATESHNFVRIARGNRVSSLNLTANENEELKMTMDLNSRAVHRLKTNEAYEARGGAGDDNDKLFNLNDTSSTAEFLEPFFFSSGKFTIFGEEFLKITNLSLTINNNLTDRRYLGVGNKSIKEGIPAQRAYELSFTALVTDNRLFEELFDQAEQTGTTLTADNGLIQLLFDKANGEQIKLQFKNYMIESANFTVPDDKGVITVEAMVRPRDLHLCEVKTHWILQG